MIESISLTPQMTVVLGLLSLGLGSYRSVDFLKAGSIMTVIFLTVTLVMLNLIY